MKRKLFFAVAFLSLLICAGCIWWWVGSSRRMDHFTWQSRGGSTVHVMGSAGKLMFTHTVAGSAPQDGQISWGSMPYGAGTSTEQPDLQWTSFTYSTRPSPGKSGVIESTLILPAWAIVGLTAIFPFMWMGGKMKPKKKPH
jgi:hypothetical protein